MGQAGALIEVLNKVLRSRRPGYAETAHKLGMRRIRNEHTLERRPLAYAEVARGLEMRRIIDKEDQAICVREVEPPEFI